ncbi:RND efflux system, outer membrane lipoprotein, NodT [Rhodospirillum rubrum ATCC 11170]|uniref:RND efflux system, outer membrane lipoprotein, NodT n=2 Tax=Rhodospirillum rubrum TaxID=1085 RepID=Q2RSP3_RHORT|nr:RND efflux system, outer membrane lipoprotein, NodT [Rhodospirillum rubrum ATCC 11170]MBK5954459.1 adeC/adeK/oprM family multidrug efflux complex outer membrane factor [Rhodospirillum rubrum]
MPRNSLSQRTPIMRSSLMSCVAVLALLGGCSFIPDYQRPAAPVPTAWPDGPAYDQAQAGGETIATLGWREFFRDPALQRLIAQALEHNRDLRSAALTVESARATYRIERADLLPTVNGGTDLTHQRTPRTATQTGKAQTTTNYSANIGTTSYEIDFFGRIRSLEEEALEQYFATEEARRSVQIALIAEVANAYITLLADRTLLQLTEETLNTRIESFNLTQQSFDRGVGTRLDVTQAQTTVETARANRAIYTRYVAQDINALRLLVGDQLDANLLAGTPPLDLGRFFPNVPAGLPSDLLLRRPDILEAEHKLVAANANIGAARAAFWPKISLTGNLGTASASLGDLFSSGSLAWSVGPSLSVPLFDFWRNEATLESAKVQREIAVAAYEKSIQTAFREVADALAAKGTLGDQLRAQQDLVAATQESYALSRNRYDQGIDNYLSTLDSQRSLYAAQQDLISVRANQLTNYITLYKVLGGGSFATSPSELPNPAASVSTFP